MAARPVGKKKGRRHATENLNRLTASWHVSCFKVNMLISWQTKAKRTMSSIKKSNFKTTMCCVCHTKQELAGQVKLTTAMRGAKIGKSLNHSVLCSVTSWVWKKLSPRWHNCQLLEQPSSYLATRHEHHPFNTTRNNVTSLSLSLSLETKVTSNKRT